VTPAPQFASVGRTGGDDSIQRDRWGRPVVPYDGRPTTAEVCTRSGKDHIAGPHLHLTRATTVAKALDDTENLSKWRERMVAIGLSTRRDLQLKVSTNLDDPHTNPSKAEIQKAADDAKEFAGSTTAATVGTALHAMAEKVNRGEDPGYVPDDLKPRLKAYYLATRGMEWLSLEQFTANIAKGVGGTPDGIARCQDGVVRIIDLKTSSSDVQFGGPAWGVQLAIYEESEFWDGSAFSPLPAGIDHDWGWVIHLPSNGVCADGSLCQIYRVPLDHKGVDQAIAVRAWRAKGKDGVLEPVPMLAGTPAVDPEPEEVQQAHLANLHAGDEPRPVEDHAPATPSPLAAVTTGQLGPLLQQAASERRERDAEVRRVGEQLLTAPGPTPDANGIVTYDVVQGPDNPVDTPDEIAQAIAVAGSKETLVALRKARIDSGWQPEHDKLAGARMALIRAGMV
jgi:hypothetical protein